MTREANVIIPMILLALTAFLVASAQLPPTIDLENGVEYQGDIYDPSRFAKKPNVTPSLGLPDFGVATVIADIGAVNGQPAKGLYAARSRNILASPTPSPGQAIADVTRVTIREHIFEILQPDGTPIGTIMSMGFSGGSPPPAGLPSRGRIG